MNTYLIAYKFITNHPLNQGNKTKALLRYVKWQLSMRLSPYPIIYPFTEKSKLIVEKGMTGATGNLYSGLHDYNDMLFLLHFLRKEDSFADIGANVGSYTILASAHVGACSISFEPVPSTFTHLRNNVLINQIQDNVKMMNVALGAEEGSINFTKGHDTMNHVATDSDEDIVTVKVESLDKVLSNEKCPALIKIDVEGYETEVIKGAKETLEKSELKAIIIELNGSGVRYGYNEADIHQTLVQSGFNPYLYDPLQRKLFKVETFGTSNTIYIRDFEYVEERLKTSDTVRISGKSF